MGRVFKFSIYLLLLFCLSLCFTACNSKKEASLDESTRAIIGNINYNSLTEAVENAKSGDTIKVYHNLKDNKSIVINKPLTIKGIVGSNQIKPKFYGSLIINLDGEEDSVKIENIDIVHQGKLSDGFNNDTRFGINLINGGIELKSCNISLDDNTVHDFDASGIVVSREINSKSIMPIIIKGNSFGNYKTDNKTLSSAMIIKSSKSGYYKNLNLNGNELYNQNTFSTGEEGNQFVLIDYSSPKESYCYYATSSASELVNALLNYQDNNGSTFVYTPISPLNDLPCKEIRINEKTTLIIEGNNSANLGGIKLLIAGSLIVNGNMENTILEKVSDTASIIISENTNKSNLTIM